MTGATGPMAIEVVRSPDLKPGAVSPGLERGLAFDGGPVQVGRTRLLPGTVGDWHHHGRRTLYGVVMAGRLRFDYGPRGGSVVTVEVGDYFRIPPGVVHRDVNPDPSASAVLVSFSVGDGPTVVPVSGPDP